MNYVSPFERPQGMSRGLFIVRLVLLLLLAVTILGLVYGWFASVEHEQKEPHGLPDCVGDANNACLEIRAGEFEASLVAGPSYNPRSRTHHFETEDGERDQVRLRLNRSSARAFEEEQVAGIYLDGDLIGIQSEDGDRTWSVPGLLSLPPLWFFGVAALVVLFLAAGLRVLNRIDAGVRKRARKAKARARR